MLRFVSSYRFASRAALREALKTKGVSRGQSISKLQERLKEFELSSANNLAEESNYSVDSIIGEKLLQSDAKYEPVLLRRQLEHSSRNNEVESDQKGEILSGKLNFPLEAEPVEAKSAADTQMETEVVGSQGEGDRGFYLEAGQYVDEYIAGSACELPDKEYDMSQRAVFGPSDSVEQIDFQLPGQKTGNSNSGDDVYLEGNSPLGWEEEVGSIDPSRAASQMACGGCGAQLHCKDGSLPGFLPVELFDKVESKHETVLCRRCHLLKNHNFLLNVNVCPVDYETMLSHLRFKPEALILLVVDMTDLVGSIHKQLPQIIGSNKPVIVIGNKVDLLPPDARCGYLKRFHIELQKAIEKAGFRDKFNIVHTALVSAKTGYGIEELITEIHLKWTNVKSRIRNDIYLVGSTNAGKSTLFNTFLQSDLCKVRAVDLVERATASVWPGTTMSLLKFPVMKPSPYRLEVRRRRLLQHRAWKQKEMYSRKRLLQTTGDAQYAVLSDVIQNTYKEQEDELQPVSIKELLQSDQEEARPVKRGWDESDPVFSKGTWCFDTPGTVNEEQVTSLFTLDELVRVLPRSLLQPRTAILSPSSSLLIGGVARVDIESTAREHSNVYLTVFASADLPLHVMSTCDSRAFYEKWLGTSRLVAPCGDEERMRRWPQLEAKEFRLRGGEKDIGCADVVLSSIGWVMVSSLDPSIRIRAWTPAAKGLAVRDPLLPYSVSLRGKRIPGTQFYKTKPIEFPVNTRRAKAMKNKNKKKGSSK